MSALPHEMGPVDDLLLCPFEDAEPAVRRWALLHLERLPWVRRLSPWTRREQSGAVWERERLPIPDGGLQIIILRVERRGKAWWWTGQGSIVSPGPHPTRDAAMQAADTHAAAIGWLFPEALPPKEAPAAEPAGRVPAGEAPCATCEGTGRERTRTHVLRCRGCDGSGREGFLAGIVRVLSEPPEPVAEASEGITISDEAANRAREAVQWVAPRRAPLVSTSTRHSWNTVRSGEGGRARFLLRCERCGMWRGTRRRHYLPESYSFNEAYDLLLWGNGETRSGRCPGGRDGGR